MFNRALKRKLTNRKWCNIYFKRDNSSLMVKNRQPPNDRQKEHESGNTLQKMYLSKSLVQICDITLYKIEVIFLWMCCTVCQHPHTHNAAPHWLLIIPTSKTRLHYFQTRFSCTWTEHRNSRLCKKTNKEKIKKTTQECTHPRTQTQTWVCASVYSFSEATEEEAQEMAPVLVNGSPKLPRLPMPSALDHESFDITLHRKDIEGFGFVILTSKSKPPYGGETVDSQPFHGWITTPHVDCFYTVYVMLKELLKWINARGDSRITFKSFYSQRTKPHFQRKKN